MGNQVTNGIMKFEFEQGPLDSLSELDDNIIAAMGIVRIMSNLGLISSNIEAARVVRENALWVYLNE